MYKPSLINITGGIFKTTNSGNSWQNISLPELSESDEKILEINFFNELNGFIITSKGGNLYTNDGGITWKLFYIETNLISVVNFYKNNIYVINTGKLLKKSISI
ncbi:MAG: hypothetical protein HC854_11395 [Flavobacterium sp.]|nr:hypothetical protein [Flavobacterium sp.]